MAPYLGAVLRSAVVACAALACAAGDTPTTTLRYVIETVAGAGLGPDGPALWAQFGYIETEPGASAGPQGIATDRDGNLYISDTYNHRVVKVSPTGQLTTIAGNGYPGFRGDGGPGQYAQLDHPYGLAVDPQGNLYVADLGNHCVRRIAADGIITTYAGTGQKGSLGDDQPVPATEAQLMSPRNLALDTAGNLYISEFEGHRVRKVNHDGIITTVAGTGVAGAGAQLNSPAGLAVDGRGNLFIADSANHRVLKLAPGGSLTTYLGDAVSLMVPVALALDASANLYVTELNAYTVRRFTPSGKFDIVAGNGQPTFYGDGGLARDAQLLSPADLAFDGLGNLYIADGPRIRRVGANRIIQSVAGDAYTLHIGDQGPAAAAQLDRPMGLALDLPGNLYIADSGANRVRMMSPAGNITTVAGKGLAGFSGDGSAPTAAKFRAPAGVAFNALGELLIADTGNNRIRLTSGDRVVVTVAGNDDFGLGQDGASGLNMPLHAPEAVLAARNGDIYIADTAGNRVLVMNAAGVVRTAAGNASAGYAGDGGGAPQAQLRGPGALSLDGAGNLFIADTLNHVIRKVDPEGIITTVAGNGNEGFGGDGGLASAANLSRPHGLAVDGDGNLYIADTGNNAVRKVTAGGVIHTIAGNGSPGFAGDGGPASSALLNAPGGLALDGLGNLYVADTGNQRVRRLTPSTEVPPAEVVQEVQLVNAASLLPGAVAPGEVVTIFGTDLGPWETREGSVDTAGSLSTRISETEVLFDGVPAPLFYVQSSRIGAQVPYTVIGRGNSKVEVRYRDQLRGRAEVHVAQAAPALYTAGGGQGQALAANEDGALNSEAAPAARGSVVLLYATGCGQTDPPGADGLAAREPYPKPALPYRFTIGNVEPEILYFGAAPGMVGVLQINARIPSGFMPTGALAVELTVAGVASQPGVTLSVK